MLAAYPQFCSYLQRACGIVINDDKRYLVESKIVPIMKRENISGLAHLVKVLESGRAMSLVQEVIHSMTINETYFFRDKAPFELISQKILPALHRALPPSAPIRIWSAACSTGQEPYTLSMIADEQQRVLNGRRIEIMATDVSETVLTRAREGKYTTFEAERGLSPERLKRYFTESAGSYFVRPKLKECITFRSLNLVDDYSPLGSFELILCRNVLIYFNPAQKSDVLRRLTRALRHDGYLFLGAAEGVIGSCPDLVQDSQLRGVYRPISSHKRNPQPPAVQRTCPTRI